MIESMTDVELLKLGVMTINEVRTGVLNLPPLEYGRPDGEREFYAIVGNLLSNREVGDPVNLASMRSELSKLKLEQPQLTLCDWTAGTQ